MSAVCCATEYGCHVAQHVAQHVTPHVTPHVLRVIQILESPKTRRELQEQLNLLDRENFRKEYLQPALQAGLIAMTKPDTPRAVDQKYFLTEKGQKLVAPGEKE